MSVAAFIIGLLAMILALYGIYLSYEKPPMLEKREEQSLRHPRVIRKDENNQKIKE